ncbi:MAG: sigma-70 family RNA polymerase sigma factor [Planctomycetaceae bacterium]
MPGRLDVTDDADLARKLLKNDQSCLEDILRLYGQGIMGLLRRQFREVLREEDFEDVLSIGLFRLWLNRDRFQPDRASLRVWLYRICENVARDVLRMGWQKTRAREVNSNSSLMGCEQVMSLQHDADGDMVAEPPLAAVHHDLNEVLREIPEVQRAILLADAAARDGVACSQRLSDELGIPPSTVRVYRKRALERVRRELTARGHGCDDGVL